MPRYVFKDMNGEEYDFVAPAGWSEDKSAEYFNNQMKTGALPKFKTVNTQSAAPQPAENEAAPNPRKGTVPVPTEAQNASYTLADTNTLGKLGLIFSGGANNTWEGAKHFFGQGRSDEEILQDRERRGALKASVGGGAHGRALAAVTETAGEIAPTLAVPFGIVARGINALRGIDAALPMSKLALGVDAATLGGVQGAMSEHTSKESNVVPTTLGVAGGALPAALVGAYQTVRRYTTNGGAVERAFQDIINALGGREGANAAASEARGYRPHPTVEDVPMSVNEILQKPEIAALEKKVGYGNDVKTQQQRLVQNEQRAVGLSRATESADQLAARKDARDAAATPLREKALGEAGSDMWIHEKLASQAQQTLNDAVPRSAEARVANIVMDTIESGATPEKLYKLRKQMSDALSTPMERLAGDKQSEAMKTAEVTTRKLRDTIDEALNAASGGKWDRYLKTFGEKSRPVDDAEAAQRIRDVFNRDSSKSVSSPAGGAETLGAVPRVSSADVGSAMEKYGKGEFGDVLDKSTRDALNSLKENSQRSEMARTLRGEHAIESPANLGEMAADVVTSSGVSKSRQFLGRFMRGETGAKAAAIRDVLNNPDAFIAGVERHYQAGMPLTESQKFVLNLLRSSGPASADMAEPKLPRRR
jgi:hypothetical protein